MNKPLTIAAIYRRGAIFADNVRRMLKESNVTVDYLANCTHVDKRTIYRILNKAHNKIPYLPCDRTVARFAHIAEVSHEDFVSQRVVYVG